MLHQAIGTPYLQAVQESAVYIQWNIVQPFKKKKKQGKPPICDNMDETWRHYANQVREKDKYYTISLTGKI